MDNRISKELDKLIEWAVEDFIELDDPEVKDMWELDKKALITKLEQLLIKARLSECSFWAEVALNSKPTHYDFMERISELQTKIRGK